MVSIVKLKKDMANICIICIVVYIFHYRQEPCSVILLLIDKCSKVNLYHAVLPLGLAIYLNMESNREFSLNIKEII